MTIVHIYPFCVESIDYVSHTNSKTKVEDREDPIAWWKLLFCTVAGTYRKKRSYQRRLSKVYYFGEVVSCRENGRFDLGLNCTNNRVETCCTCEMCSMRVVA